ncbi:hypothetical protein BWK47_07595 [Synechocystis sp. CACIAM 05]|nr:hypothetical protein BWK47_07595 [Synechocystis sp. CACIAM 05]
MSSLNLSLSNLNSGKIRTLATRTLDGIRAIGGAKTQNENDDGNILVRIWNKVNKLGAGVSGFLLNAIGGGLQWTFTSIMTQVQMGVRFLWNFNWNATDAELDAQYAAYMNLLAGTLGGTIGNAVGWAVCGAGPGLIMMKFNKLLALRVLQEVGEEALDELMANLRVLVQQAAQLAFRQTLITSYKNGRRLLKEILLDPNGRGKVFREALGINTDRVKEWGEKGTKPWSFAIALDNWIESIKNPLIQNFTEELIEEFFDSCSEAFYVVANTADQYMMEQKLGQASLLGDQEFVEITPNRDNEEEKIIIAGPAELIKPTIVQTLAQHQLLEERDLGMWVGEPVREAMKSPPMSIQLRIIMSSKQKSVFKAKRVQITIPNVDRGRLNWLDIKQRVGGANGYMWGRYKAKAQLSGGHSMFIWAATDADAVDRITMLATLSNEEILGITVTEEKREGSRLRLEALRKQPTRIYPWAMTIINQQKVLSEESGIAQLSGVYQRRQKSLIPLHTATRPDNYSELIADLFRIPGPNG